MTGLTSDAVTPPDGEDDSTATKDRALALIRALKEKVAAAQRTTDTDEQSKRPDTMHTYHVSFQGRRGNARYGSAGLLVPTMRCDDLRSPSVARPSLSVTSPRPTTMTSHAMPSALPSPTVQFGTDCVEIEQVRAWVRLNGESADPYASQRFSGWQWAWRRSDRVRRIAGTPATKDFRPTAVTGGEGNRMMIIVIPAAPGAATRRVLRRAARWIGDHRCECTESRERTPSRICRTRGLIR